MAPPQMPRQLPGGFFDDLMPENLLVDAAASLIERTVAGSGAGDALRSLGNRIGVAMMEGGGAAAMNVPLDPSTPMDPPWFPRIYKPILAPFIEGLASAVRGPLEKAVAEHAKGAAMKWGAIGLGAGALGTWAYLKFGKK